MYYYKIVALIKGLKTEWIHKANSRLEAEAMLLAQEKDAFILSCECYGRLVPRLVPALEPLNNVIKADFVNKRRVICP